MKTRTLLAIWICALAVGVACYQARAVDFHVATAQALQNALFTAAHNGVNNNVYLTNGSYLGNFNYNSSGANNLTLLPEPGITNAAITIDGGGVGMALNISSAANTNSITIQGLSFALNSGLQSGISALQIGVGNQATLLVSGCRLFGTNSGGSYGLSCVSGGNIVIDGCEVTANAVNLVGTGVTVTDLTGKVAVRNCVFSGLNGPALAAFGWSIAISNDIFVGNLSCLNTGGGISYPGSVSAAGTLTVSSNIFNGNPSSFYLAQIADFSTVTFSGNTINANYSPVSINGNTAVVITNNTFTGNFNGALSIQDQNTVSGLVYATNVTLLNNSFVGNSNGVGTVYVNMSDAAVTVQANTFEQNKSIGAGGALYVSAPIITIANNLVVANTQTSASSTGGGIWVDASADLYFINNTITGNVSAGGGGGVAFKLNGSVEVLNVFNNIIWGNSASPGADVWLSGTGAERLFSNNDTHDLFGIWDLFVNNLDIDPQFVAPASGNYHLQKSSPCLDAGTTAGPFVPAVDLDGNPRTVGGTVDLGCYELSAPTPLMVRLSLPSNGGVQLQWPSTVGASYIVQQSTDLRQGFHNWTGTLPATPPINTFSDIFQRGATTVFYRIIAQ